MNKKVLFVSALLMGIAIVASVSYVQAMYNVSNFNLTNRIIAHANETFYITLYSNPSTGYQWQLANVTDQNVVRLVGTEYIAPEVALLGAGGKQIFTFEALREGKTTVTLEYVRPWENVPAQTYVFDVIVL